MATTYNTPAVAPIGASVTHRIVGVLSAMVAAVRQWNDTRRTVAALYRLSDAQLDDIGLTRGDIQDMARRGF